MKAFFLCFFALLVCLPFACKHQIQAEYEESSSLKLDKHVPNRDGLEVRDGFLEFSRHEEIAPFKAVLPEIANKKANDFLKSKDTMWYDDKSMLFSYQDSQETVVGIRHNSVGYDVGVRNKNSPAIGKLTTYFNPTGFKFPFNTTAGTDNSPNIKVYTLWKTGISKTGRILPVVYWKDNNQSRRRWRWLFPIGTMFGEALYIKGPDGKYAFFEFRTRERYIEGWSTDVFRPYTTSKSLVNAIKKLRPNWASQDDLKTLVSHLENNNTLKKMVLKSKPYAKIFRGLEGGQDTLPPISDPKLVTELLNFKTFESQTGIAWKKSGDLESYAPTTQAEYHIVPKNYTAGFIAVNEVSCGRCHVETGRRVGDLDGDVVLYGEMWGEDRIFSWHLFEPTRKMYATFDQTRKINSLLVKAKLVKFAKPVGDGSTYYRSLPVDYSERYF
jgi:hypothetical protein